MEHTISTVICVLNSQYIHSSLAPWYLQAGIKKYCDKMIQAAVVEGTINENINDVAERILAHKPHVVAFCCYIWNITVTRKLIQLVKAQLPQTIIVLGGPEVSYNAEFVLSEEPLVDYIISGEGEKPYAYLARAIAQNTEVEHIPGICYRDGKQIVISDPYFPKEEPPNPYTDDYYHALEGRIAYLETSRGCPYSCAFCLSGSCGSVRYFDFEEIKERLLLLASSGTQTIKLVDRTFNANRKRANELFAFIIDNYGKSIPQGICFHFEIAGDLLGNETIHLLASAPAGAIQFEIGVQSFNEKTLAAVTRITDVKSLKENIRRVIANANIHVHIDLIAGLPYEDLDSFKASFNAAYSLQPHALQLGFLKILPGTPMRNETDKYPCVYSDQPPYEVQQTPWISSRELDSLHRTEDALNRLYNSGRFRRTLHYVLQETMLTPFDLFSQFGEYASAARTHKISLDDYTALVYAHFSKLDGVHPAILRDVMACDRLATNPSGKLPAVLRIQDPGLKKAVMRLEKDTLFDRRKKRGYALLYHEKCLVYAEYCCKDPVTGEYPLYKYDLDKDQH